MKKPLSNLSRRRFIKQSAITLAGAGLMGQRLMGQELTLPAKKRSNKQNQQTLNVIAYNILAGRGWPQERELAVRSRDRQQFASRIALELSLYDPDIIAFQESPAEEIIQQIARHLEMDYAFLPSAGNWPGAILTHHDIVEYENVPLVTGSRSDDLFTRHWGRAAIRLESGENLVVHSVHLYPHDNPESREIRIREITEILTSMESDFRSDASMLVLADLNHMPQTPEYEMWMEAGWKDTYEEAGTGDGNTINAADPDRRIDYVLARGPISDRLVEARALFEGNFRTNPDDDKSFALSDHLPHLAQFELSR